MQKFVTSGFRMSPQQEHLWLLWNSDRSEVYRAHCAILLEGPLDRVRLEKALKKTVARHDILRTTFRRLSDGLLPVQVVAEACVPVATDYDLSSLSPHEQETGIESLYHELSRAPLGHEHAPLLRLSLARLSPLKHVLYVSVPALCADQPALGNLFGEISRSYAESGRGEGPDDEAIQYAVLSEWQHELLEADDTQAGRAYWQKQDASTVFRPQLADEKEPLDKLAFELSYFSLRMREALAAQVEERARASEVSSSVFLLACWHVLLWRLTGQQEVTVGFACNGRKYEELEKAHGLLAKYLPMRIGLTETSRFTDILRHLHDAAGELYKWQEYFGWEGAENRNGEAQVAPFFPYCFEFNEEPAKVSAAGLSFSILKRHAHVDRFKLKLSCVRKPDGLNAEFHYDSHIFRERDIERLSAQFYRLLESAIDNPSSLISEMEILGEAERNRILVEFNATKVDYPEAKHVHQLLEQQAAAAPESVALAFEERRVTYDQLNSRANQLAHYLRAAGVRAETRVGICAERSIEMIECLMSVLKAAGAYVPLDLTFPQDRLSFIMEDARLEIVLAEEHLLERLPAGRAKIICIDRERAQIERESRDNPGEWPAPENLAYVIYTSGSTGDPKGVAVEHRQLSNYVRAISEQLGLPRQSSFAAVSTPAADLGYTALFPSLCTGGTLHILSNERISDADALADYCSRNRIDCLKIVPSHFEALLASTRSALIVPGQRLVLGGEASKWDLIERVRSLSPQCEIFNHYGPTESTVGVLTYRVKGSSAPESVTVPLGKPLSNTQAYVLNARQQPVPTGQPGELYLGGSGLARGYFNKPDLTAERFVPNPFALQEPGARLYRTGDMARHLPQGNMEFLGRIDDQVKVRGFRVELGEIEAVLERHPGVQDAVVLPREDGAGHKRLVAYVVAIRRYAATQGVEKEVSRDTDRHPFDATRETHLPLAGGRDEFSETIEPPPTLPAPLSVEDLIAYLGEKLPDYMMPSAFVMLDTLPLNPNGKVDRKALPAPDEAKPDSGRDYVAPRTPVERALAGVWAQVLGVERVGIHDNFFKLGGDSIMSIQIIARMNQSGIRLMPRQMFQHPTLAELAAVAEVAGATSAEQGLVVGELPLTPIQHWFLDSDPVDPHHWNMAMMLDAKEKLDPAILESSVRRLVAHHDALRLRFERNESGWRQVNSGLDEGLLFTLVDLSALAGDQRPTALETAAAQIQTGLNLAAGPVLWVAQFITGEAEPDKLLFVIHHLSVDGVSWRILLEDLPAVYESLRVRETVRLPPKTTSFMSWSESLTEHAQSSGILREAEYWLDESRREVAPFPVDYQQGVNTIGTASVVSVSLTVEETQSLLRDVPEAYHTQINDVLLTALAQTLRDWAKSRLLLIDLEGHGREDILSEVDISRTVGFFTTRFPVLLDLGDTKGHGAELTSIKESLRRIPNHGIGYGLLRYLSRDRSLSERLRDLPQPEVSFNYLGQLDTAIAESSLFAPSRELHGPVRSLRQPRRHLLEINGAVARGQLEMAWTYSEARHRRSSIEDVSQKFIEALRSLINHCLSPEAGGYSPSDFAEFGWNQQELDDIVAKINGSV
jgi:amino acid adenylation domain-containing protein/non-ribosomal peptide synthase protein (TIGR01720 family)